MTTAKTFTFDTTIRPGDRGGAFVEIPLDVPRELGTRGRVPVVATFDGEEYRGSIAPMGGRHVLGVVKSVRQAIGKDVGQTVRVVIRLDTKERTVEIPGDLYSALADEPAALQFLEGLSFTNRKEFVRWITTAKRPETRVRRVQKAVEMLLRGETL